MKQGKCRTPCLGWNKLTQQDCMGSDLLGISFAEKALCFWLRTGWRLQCALAIKKAVCMLGCVGKSIAIRLWKVILTLWLSFEITSGILCPALESTLQERFNRVIVSLADGYQASFKQASGFLSDVKGEAEGAGLIQLEEERTVCNHQMWSMGKLEPNSSWRCLSVPWKTGLLCAQCTELQRYFLLNLSNQFPFPCVLAMSAKYQECQRWNWVPHLSSRKWEYKSIPVSILFGSPNVILLTL